MTEIPESQAIDYDGALSTLESFVHNDYEGKGGARRDVDSALTEISMARDLLHKGNLNTCWSVIRNVIIKINAVLGGELIEDLDSPDGLAA